MYLVRTQQHEKYGLIILVERSENGAIHTPFHAIEEALRQKRALKEDKPRLLVDDQIMTSTQAERWCREEYQRLPKCQACAKILGGEVYTHQLCGDSLFCRQACADQAYHEQLEKLKDEEEIDYL